VASSIACSWNGAAFAGWCTLDNLLEHVVDPVVDARRNVRVAKADVDGWEGTVDFRVEFW
jgi:hypothetical protein